MAGRGRRLGGGDADVKPVLLDLFCGAGGAARGYQQAGFYVVGVDIKPQPRYAGDEFIQADAMTFPLDGYDAIHASPPCQAYTLMNQRWPGAADKHPRLIEETRSRLTESSALFVIENVVGAPLRNAIKLCGSNFGLGTVRHRLFESNAFMLAPGCHCRGWRDHAGVFGMHPDGGRLWTRKDGHAPQRRVGSLLEGQQRMGIDWMVWTELKEAIPPAYTHYIGTQLMAVLT